MASFIPDHYTEDGYIAEFPGVHGALRFRYRRALGWQCAEARRTAASLKPREAEAHWAKFLKGQLVDWELQTPDGKPVDLTEPNILRMNPALSESVLGVVMSVRSSDPDPARPEVPEATLPGDREGADVGNLPPG